jgi:hypothetical protein
VSDVFEEVEESLRQDKATLWWKRYGIFVWILGIGIVAAVAYNEWSTGQNTKQTIERVESFEKARTLLANGDYDAAQSAFADLAGSGAEIAPLAAQFLAQTQYEGSGDIDNAAQTLAASGGDAGPVERLALLKAAYMKSETMTLSELEAFLGELPRRPTAIGVLASELIAAKAFSEGDFTRAREEFSYLQLAANAPPGVAQRAEVALTVIPVPDQTAPAAAPEEQAPDLGDSPAEREAPDSQTQGTDQ